MFRLLCLLCLAAVAAAEVIEKFESSEIIPDVIDSVQESLLKVSFPSENEVMLGNELTPKQVKDEPKVEWVPEEGAFYTLLLTDPDAPSRAQPVVREWHHWLVVNIKGCDVASGDVLSQYVSSAPPQDSGLHRYVFLLFKQPNGRMDYSEVPKIAYSGEGRAKFNTKNFMNKYMLTAIAGNFYQAQYDDSVPAIHKALGF